MRIRKTIFFYHFGFIRPNEFIILEGHVIFTTGVYNSKRWTKPIINLNSRPRYKTNFSRFSKKKKLLPFVTTGCVRFTKIKFARYPQFFSTKNKSQFRHVILKLEFHLRARIREKKKKTHRKSHQFYVLFARIIIIFYWNTRRYERLDDMYVTLLLQFSSSNIVY